MRICLIDDEPIVLETISGFLADLGHEVNCASYGGDLDAVAEGSPVDLVIADPRLTGSNGFDFIYRLRELFSGTPIVVISGHRTALLSMPPVIENEVYATLSKPFSLGELELLLSRVSTEPSDRVSMLEMDVSDSAGGSE